MRRSSAALTAIVIFALLHAATVPASAWRPGVLPFTAAGTVTPFLLLALLIEQVAVWNPIPIFIVALILTGILLAAAIVKRADWFALSALLGAGLWNRPGRPCGSRTNRRSPRSFATDSF